MINSVKCFLQINNIDLPNTTIFVPNGGPRIELQSSLECFVQSVFTQRQVALPDTTSNYQSTENLTLKKYQFRSLAQQKHSLHSARISKGTKHCQFKLRTILSAQSHEQHRYPWSGTFYPDHVTQHCKGQRLHSLVLFNSTPKPLHTYSILTSLFCLHLFIFCSYRYN